jgi:hypothetical protein
LALVLAYHQPQVGNPNKKELRFQRIERLFLTITSPIKSPAISIAIEAICMSMDNRR